MNDTNYTTNKRFCVLLGNNEFAEASYQQKTNCIYVGIGDNENDENSYGFFLSKREARQLIHCIHDAVREANKYEHR